MSVTASSVKAIGGAPFASLTDSTVEAWIELAERRLSSGFFGSDYADAVTFWVLHHLATNVLSGGASGQTGPVSSVSVGSVSTSFGSGTSDSSQYNSTAWGRMYLALGAGAGISVATAVRPEGTWQGV